MNRDVHYKKLLFVDQSLEELVTQYNSESSLFSEPYQLWREGNLDGAIARLKQISADPKLKYVTNCGHGKRYDRWERNCLLQ